MQSEFWREKGEEMTVTQGYEQVVIELAQSFLRGVAFQFQRTGNHVTASVVLQAVDVLNLRR